MPEEYDATRSLNARPENWGVVADADLRVQVTHTEGTAAILTLKLAGDRVGEAKFKSRGLGDRTLLLARAIRATEGKRLPVMACWQVKQLAEAAGVDLPRDGMDRTAIELALLALRNAIHAHGSDGSGSAATAVIDIGARTICYCMEVSEATIRAAIRDRGATTVEQITAHTGATGGCGTCRPDVQAILDRAGVEPEPDDPTAPYRQDAGPPWVVDATEGNE